MATIATLGLIKITDEDIKKARQFYDLDDEKRIQESLDAIDEWFAKQEHLAEARKYTNRNLLERIFILARGSVEGTKKRIDKLFTSRGMMPELCHGRSFEEFEKLWHCLNYVPLPKLCPTDQSRVMVTQFLTDKLDEFSIYSYFRYAFMVGEFRINFDYSLSERYIIDMKNINISLLGKINPVAVKKAEILCTEGFGTKIKGIHILNAPSFVDKVVFILKQALREKVASRLHVHNTFEDLHKHIPKEILPKEYGGDETSCSKLAGQWRDIFQTEESKEIIKNSEKLISDESKRLSSTFNEEYMGMPGSFRRLNVD